ncbi:hypothetical protein [Enterococcus olivae]
MDKDLIIFLVNGSTLRFQNVNNFKDDGEVITFDYFGVATQTKRDAMFDLGKIAGYALSAD